MNAAVQEQRHEDVRDRDDGIDRDALEQIVALTSDGVLLLDAQASGLPIRYVNPSYEALTGFASSELVGSPWSVLGRHSAGAAAERLRSAIDGAEAVEVDLADRRKDGSRWSSTVRLSPLKGADGALRWFLVLQRGAPAAPAGGDAEISLLRRELGRARAKIDNMNRNDPITGLLRYEYFIDVLNRDLAVARRERRPVAVMAFEILDLDVYRDTFGSKAAESCVRMIAAQISGAMRRAGDLCARWDDTLIAASAVGQEQAQADVLVERIVANVRGLKLHNPRSRSGRYVGVAAASTGGVPAPGDDAETLLGRVKTIIAQRR
ncbi:MAG: diguanylate cyclase [Gammaproteobacteria bacterium]|nr:diguanylate cyclase [Gammaproteobacteria bacterium]